MRQSPGTLCFFEFFLQIVSIRFQMTPTIYKVLLHGDEIFCYFIVHIGCLSEEPQEASNEDFSVLTISGQKV